MGCCASVISGIPRPTPSPACTGNRDLDPVQQYGHGPTPACTGRTLVGTQPSSTYWAYPACRGNLVQEIDHIFRVGHTPQMHGAAANLDPRQSGRRQPAK